MGIRNLQDIVDAGEPASPEEIDAHREVLVGEAKQTLETKAEVEMDFATRRQAIEDQYANSVAKAAEKRAVAHAKNIKKREDALEKLDLNPRELSRL